MVWEWEGLDELAACLPPAATLSLPSPSAIHNSRGNGCLRAGVLYHQIIFDWRDMAGQAGRRGRATWRGVA